MAAGAILVNLMTHLGERYGEQYDILPSIDVSFPEQDFTCDLGLFPPHPIDWFNDLIRVEPPITAFEIVMPTETSERLIDAIRTHYFPNGVKSAWILAPGQRTVSLVYPGQPAQVFTDGIVHDAVTGIELPLSEVFA